MRLRPEQLSKHLEKTPAPIYYVSGDEPLQIQECCDAIRACFRREGFSEREIMQVDKQFDWQQLLDSANSLSLFAERKLIELRMNAAKPGDAGSKVLQRYVEHLNPDTALLISSAKIDKSSQASKWFKALESPGVIIQVWPVETRQLPRWIEQRLRQRGLRADADALRLIAEKVEGNLLAAAQEVEKLTLLAKDNTVSIKTVSASVADSSRHTIFELVDQVLAGQAKSALRVLAGLRAEGTEATLIVWALSRELRILEQARFLSDKGQSTHDLFVRQRIFDKRKPLLLAALQRLSGQQIRAQLALCQQIDLGCKGLRKASVWEELSTVILAMVGEPLPSPQYYQIGTGNPY